jgi:hypothetical protein
LEYCASLLHFYRHILPSSSLNVSFQQIPHSSTSFDMIYCKNIFYFSNVVALVEFYIFLSYKQNTSQNFHFSVLRAGIF